MVGSATAEWTAIVVSVAAAAAAIAAFRGRALAGPACRRCGHAVAPDSVSTVIGRACAECGAAWTSQKDIQARHRRPLVGSIALTVGLLGLGFGIGDTGRTLVLKQVLPEYRVEATQTVAQTTVRVLRSRWPDSVSPPIVEVLLRGHLAYRSACWYPTFGSFDLDIRRLGGQPPIPCIWICENFGGSGGQSCTTVFAIELGDSADGLRPFAFLHNGSFERDVWVQYDDSYRYWLTSGAGSPMPKLRGVLESPFEGNDSAGGGTGPLRFLEPGPSDAPTPAELEAHLAVIRSSEPTATASDAILSATLRGFLGLVYAGRSAEAWRFLDACLDAGLRPLLESGAVSDLPRSREGFQGVLLERMRRSPFLPELLRRNGGSISPTDR